MIHVRPARRARVLLAATRDRKAQKASQHTHGTVPGRVHSRAHGAGSKSPTAHTDPERSRSPQQNTRPPCPTESTTLMKTEQPTSKEAYPGTLPAGVPAPRQGGKAPASLSDLRLLHSTPSHVPGAPRTHVHHEEHTRALSRAFTEPGTRTWPKRLSMDKWTHTVGPPHTGAAPGHQQVGVRCPHAPRGQTHNTQRGNQTQKATRAESTRETHPDRAPPRTGRGLMEDQK